MRRWQERGGGLALAWVAGFVVLGTAAWAARDYSRWMSMGPGGLPANVRGWLTMRRFRLIAKDELDVRPLLAAAAGKDDLRAWNEVRRRCGTRPAVSPYTVPHRQLDNLPGEEVRIALRQLFDRTVTKHDGQVEYALSYFEKRHPAITLKAGTASGGDRPHGEIAHIHPRDSSMHMILSPSDAIAAIGAGWAQRHGLAGIAAGLPLTYVMVYSPRNQDDLQGIEDLLEAAIAYATHSARLLAPSSPS